MFATTGQTLASQRFSGPGLNAALISVHQSASPEAELSTPLGTVREELANFFENERLSIGVANTTSCLLQEIERSSEYNKLKKHATAHC